MEPAVIVTTAILLTLVVGIVIQTIVSYVKKAKKDKKSAKDKRKRPESNKENVIPSSTPFGAPHSATSFTVSSGGQTTKVTEESHYQQIKSSVIRSESPIDPPKVLKHETTKTELRTSSGDKLIPLCVEAFQDSVLSPISGFSKTKKQEVTESSSSYEQFQSNTVRSGSETKSTAEKLLPKCVEAFQDSVLSPISGIKKTKNQESQPVASPMPFASSKPGKTESQAQKLLPVCVEAFQDSVLSPISGIKKTKTQEVHSSMVHSMQTSSSAPSKPWNVVESQGKCSTAENLLPVCVEAFQDCVLSPITGISRTKKQEIQSSMTRSATPPVPNTVPKPWKSPTETESYQAAAAKLLPMCLEAFQDSVLSPISGISKTMKAEIRSSPIRSVTPPKPWKPDTQAKSSSAEKVLPLCVQAFQDSVLSPISGVSRTKVQEITDQSRETMSSVTRSQTPPFSQQSQVMAGAQKLLPTCVEAFRDSVLSPISGVSKTKTHEVTKDGNKTEKTTTETIQETKGSCQTTILRKEKESIVHDSFATGNRPIFQASPLSSVMSQPSTFATGNRPIFQATPLSAVMSQPSTVKMTKSETKSTETRHNVWKPTGEVAGKIKGFSYTQDAAVRNKPVAPATQSVMSSDVYNRSEMDNSTMTRKKKQFASSSFYQDEYSSFPTIEQQVQLCRQIADSLVEDTGKKSKGASMFDRRMKRSTSWVHENPDNEDEPSTPEQQSEGQEASDMDAPRAKSKTPPSLKLILDPRLPQDVVTLKTSGQQISEHNVVSPNVCHHLVKDLESPVGKGGALFAKRKKKAEDWVVDEEKVKEHTKTPEPIPEPPVPSLHKLKEKFQNPKLKLVKSPWDAALQSPIGSVDGAFVDVKPVKLVDNVIKAADYKIRSNSQSPVSEGGPIPHFHPMTPPVSGIYKPTAPRGWTGRGIVDEYNNGMPSGAFSPEPPMLPSRTFVQSPMNKPTFQNFNITPKTWNEAKKTEQPAGFKPVRPPTYYAK